MRGESNRQQALFSYVSIEERIPAEHPIRRVKLLCDQVLRKLSEMFEGMYSELGRPSIPPERLLKSQVLMALYSVRSDRMFCERLNWDMLFRCFWRCHSMNLDSMQQASRKTGIGFSSMISEGNFWMKELALRGRRS